MNQRLYRLFSYLDESIDCLLIKNGGVTNIDPTFFYLTGLEQGLFEGCILVAHRDGTLDLIVSELEAELAEAAKASLHLFSGREQRDHFLKKLLKNMGTISFNGTVLTYKDMILFKELFSSSTFVDVHDDVQQCRLVKDPDELGKIKKACGIADKVAGRIPAVVESSMTEDELAACIDYELQRAGAQHPAFTTIASFGSHSSQPHFTHSDTPLKTADVILCDFGACFQRYNSDLTRTFVYSQANEEFKAMHQIVLEAQQVAFDMIQPGVKAAAVHQAVADFIDVSPFKGWFIHSTGHALGLEVHDGPGFSQQSDLILEENMVFTVEPGVYKKGAYGVRIEDDIVVTRTGCQLLTNADRSLLQIR